MTIFPTTILVATDGSEEAVLALTTAADVAKSNHSELHVAYVFPTAVQRPFPNPFWRGRPTRWNTSSRRLCTRPRNSSTSRWRRSRARG